MNVQEHSAGRVRVVHVPKTIDNDLDLPPYVDTFGYQTARHYGVDVVKNLMVDAKTTSRWYFVVAMGRTAGHLALGIGKAAGATITLITEEFTRPVRLKTHRRHARRRRSSSGRAMGRHDGVAVVAEGLSLAVDPEDFAGLERRARRARTHPAGRGQSRRDLKGEVTARLQELGLKTTIAEKNIGYELRCADPIPFDIEYTRDLGYCAAKYLIEGGSAAMVSHSGRPVRAGAVLADGRPRDGEDARAARRHHLDPLRHRAPLHGPSAARRLRGCGGARENRAAPSICPPTSSAKSSSISWRPNRRRSC